MIHDTRRQQGFGLVGILVVVLAVALLAFIGYRVWDAQTNKNSQQQTTQQESADQPITNDTELQQADQELEKTDVDGSDMTDLEAQTNY